MLRAVVLVVFAGCGRLAFEPTSADAAPPDATARVCPEAPVDDPVVITGTTFSYEGFDGVRMPYDNVTVRALSPANAVLATASSDGDYQLVVPTGGAPTPARLEYARPGYYTTTVTLDAPLARSITAPTGISWRPGDGPIWSTGSVGSVYSTAGATRDIALGSMDVIVLDCADVPVEGATVTASPPPAVTFYQADSGTGPDSATGARYGRAVLLGAPPGPTRVTATHPTRAILGAELVVEAGTHVAIVVLRASD